VRDESGRVPGHANGYGLARAGALATLAVHDRENDPRGARDDRGALSGLNSRRGVDHYQREASMFLRAADPGAAKVGYVGQIEGQRRR
jgi:hypothetical protein